MRLNPLTWFTSRTKALKTQVSDLTMQIKSFEQQFAGLMRSNSFAGENVTVSGAMALDTVYACIRDKSESVGQIPVLLKRNGKKIEKTRREYKIFGMKPNSYQTMQDLLEMYITCMETRGNFYILPIRNRLGNISELLPFRFQENVITNVDVNGSVYHTYVTNDGKPGIAFAGGDIIHIKLNSLDGIVGISPILSQAIAVGIASAQEKYLGSLMENAAMPKGILYTDAVFSDANAILRLKEDWKKNSGMKNAGNTPVLENNLKYQAMGLSPADTELILQRTFSKNALCSIFRVPSHRINVSDTNRYGKLEDNNRAYLRDSLVPMITKFEMAMQIAIGGSFTFTLDVTKYARGDRLSQVEALKAEFSTGAISHNEMRDDLGRDEIEGGDFHAIDTNNFTFGVLSDIPKLQEQNRLAAQTATNAQPSNEDSDDE